MCVVCSGHQGACEPQRGVGGQRWQSLHQLQPFRHRPEGGARQNQAGEPVRRREGPQ